MNYNPALDDAEDEIDRLNNEANSLRATVRGQADESDALHVRAQASALVIAGLEAQNARLRRALEGCANRLESTDGILRRLLGAPFTEDGPVGEVTRAREALK
jgi:chromosome segregation ATPase